MRASVSTVYAPQREYSHLPDARPGEDGPIIDNLRPTNA